MSDVCHIVVVRLMGFESTDRSKRNVYVRPSLWIQKLSRLIGSLYNCCALYRCAQLAVSNSIDANCRFYCYREW